MSTENKRVAAYFPASLAEKFEVFKSEHRLGDSQALVVIVSQFLGVSHSDPQISSDYDERLKAIEEKLDNLKSELKSGLLSELKNELLLQNKDKSESLGNILNESQEEKLPRCEPKSDSDSNILSELLLSVQPSLKGKPLSKSLELSSELLQPMSGYALDKRFNILKGNVGKMKTKHKNNPQRFNEWTKSKDPDGVAWEPRDGLYYPINAS